MKKTSTLLLLLLSLCSISLIASDLTPGIEYGDNFIVFEAEVASYSTEYWTLRTPADAEYEKYVNSSSQSGINPINDTYLEYIGPWKGDEEASKIVYKFTCQSTGDYQLAMRLHQPLKDDEEGDAKNDVFVKMEGDYTSASKFTTEDLATKHKFWGRGVNKWGTAQYLEHNDSHFPIYHLTEGKEYTFSMYGRSTNACIDYIIFYKTELQLGVNNTDFAQQNPELYRPGGPATLLDKVAKILFDKSSTYLTRIGETKEMNYKIFPSTAVDQTITWTSSNTDIVKVDQEGVITAIAEGKAVITATTNEGNKTAENHMEVGKFIETFDDYISYDNNLNTYMGDNGIKWDMKATNTIRMGTANSIQFNKGKTGVKADKIPGGIASFSVQCENLYSEDVERTIELLINDNVVGSINNLGTSTYDFTVEDIDIAGDFSLALRNATEGDKSNTIMFDNLTWKPLNPEEAIIDNEDDADNAVDSRYAMELSVYPNPSQNGIIRLNGIDAGNYLVSIYNLQGTNVRNFRQIITSDNGTSFNLEGLNAGIYFIVLVGDNAAYKAQFIIKGN